MSNFFSTFPSFSSILRNIGEVLGGGLLLAEAIAPLLHDPLLVSILPPHFVAIGLGSLALASKVGSLGTKIKYVTKKK